MLKDVKSAGQKHYKIQLRTDKLRLETFFIVYFFQHNNLLTMMTTMALMIIVMTKLMMMIRVIIWHTFKAIHCRFLSQADDANE